MRRTTLTSKSHRATVTRVDLGAHSDDPAYVPDFADVLRAPR